MVPEVLTVFSVIYVMILHLHPSSNKGELSLNPNKNKEKDPATTGMVEDIQEQGMLLIWGRFLTGKTWPKIEKTMETILEAARTLLHLITPAFLSLGQHASLIGYILSHVQIPRVMTRLSLHRWSFLVVGYRTILEDTLKSLTVFPGAACSPSRRRSGEHTCSWRWGSFLGLDFLL